MTLSIVSHGHGPLLGRLLRDLSALPSVAQSKVIVTLNRADEQFDAAEFEPLCIQVIRNAQPKGFGANHNAAFGYCTTPWFAVLNPDLQISEDPFPALLEAASRWPDVALVVPRIRAPSGAPEDSVRQDLTLVSLLKRCVLGQREPITVDHPARIGAAFYWFAGMFMLLRSTAFRALGGFDERFFMYCEDYDLCARLYAAGHALALEPNAVAIHDARRDSHRSVKHLRWHLASLLRVWSSSTFWRLRRMR